MGAGGRRGAEMIMGRDHSYLELEILMLLGGPIKVDFIKRSFHQAAMEFKTILLHDRQ